MFLSVSFVVVLTIVYIYLIGLETVAHSKLNKTTSEIRVKNELGQLPPIVQHTSDYMWNHSKLLPKYHSTYFNLYQNPQYVT